jgi:hypothetical protein
MRKTHETFVSEVKSARGSEYIVVGEYTTNYTKIQIKHTVCGTIYDVAPSNFLGSPKKKGTSCPFCKGAGAGINREQMAEWFKIKVSNKVGSAFTVIGKYSGTHVPIEMLHNECNRITKVSPTNFLKETASTRCVHCQREQSMSQGELEIKKWLDENDADYTFEWFCPGLNEERANHRYSFDFKVEMDDGSFCLIEFNGELHYRPWRGDSESALKKLHNTQNSDIIKKAYCEREGIPLLIIPYTNLYQIPTILEKFFQE